MYATSNKKVLTSTICLLCLIATPLSEGLFAQEGVSSSTEESIEENTQFGEEVLNSSETAEDEESGSTIVKDDKGELWYKTERISGNINVGDFVVGPGRAVIEIKPGETVVQEIAVTNRISDKRTFRLEVEDITGSADGSSAVSLTGAERGPYSIRDYITFPEDEFELALGERARIPVTITVPPDAEPGGFYGSVLVSTVRKSVVNEQGIPGSPLIPRIGSLFFITVDGDIAREGRAVSIGPLDSKLWFETGPIDLGILFENTGSIHLDPEATVSISNMLGEEVGYVELEPWFVLPSSLRVRELSWDREFLLGRYTVTAEVNRGYDGIIDTVSVSFWVLPWKMVGGMFLILFIVIFSLRAFFRTFEFKRKGD